MTVQTVAFDLSMICISDKSFPIHIAHLKLVSGCSLFR